MTKKNQIKTTFWIVLTCFSMIIIHVFVLQIERNNLFKKGTETVGIITHTYISKSSKITPYVIRFSFIKDDTIIDMTNSLDKRNALPGDKIDDEIDEDYMRLMERVYVEQQRVEKNKTWWKNY